MTAIATANITTQNLNPNSGVPTAGSTVGYATFATAVGSYSIPDPDTVTVQVTGTYTQLMDRRRKFADRNGLSMRTVERLEDTGAAILDDHFRRTMADPVVYDILLRMESDVALLKRSGRDHGISQQMLDTLEVIVGRSG